MKKSQHQQAILKAIQNKDILALEQAFREAREQNIEIIDEDVKSAAFSSCKSLLVLAKNGVSITINEVVCRYNNFHEEYEEYKELVLYLLLQPNQEIKSNSVRLILKLALDKNDIETADIIFEQINQNKYKDILQYGLYYKKESVEWLANKMLLNKDIDKESVEMLIAKVIKKDLWELCDLIISKYPQINLSKIVEEKCLSSEDLFNKNCIEELLKRVNEDDQFKLTKEIISISLRSHSRSDNYEKVIQYLIKVFPKLTINDILQKYINYQSQSFDDQDPLFEANINIIILLLRNTSKVQFELAQRIFNIVLVEASYQLKMADFYQETIAMMRKREPLLSYHQSIYYSSYSSTNLQFLLAIIPQEQISEEFKQRLVAQVIKSSDEEDNLIIVNKFLEENKTAVDYMQQLLILKDRIDTIRSGKNYLYLLKKINMISVEIAQDLLNRLFGDSYIKENIEIAELIISKTDKDKLAYSNLIVKNVDKWHNLHWLLKQTKTISSQDATKLVDSLLNHGLNIGIWYEILKLIIAKSLKLNLTPFLNKVNSHQLLKLFLEQIEEAINDADIAQHIAKIAILHNGENLFNIVEAKVVRLNYNLLLNSAIESKDVNMVRNFLNKGADVNLSHAASNYYSYGFTSSKYPLEVALDIKTPQEADDIIELLIANGAKLSLINLNNLSYDKKPTIIGYLCKHSNYQFEEYLSEIANKYKEEVIELIVSKALKLDDKKLIKLILEKYLSEISTEGKEKIFKLIVSKAFELDDEGLIELIIGYGFKISSKNYLLLEDAIYSNKLKIVTLLTNMQGPLNKDEFIIHDVIEKNNNQLLELLCQQGYDYNHYLPRKDNFIFIKKTEMHPLEYAIYIKNSEAAKILLRYINSKESSNIKTQCLLRAINEEQQEMALLLLDKDTQIQDETKILCLACSKGMLNLVKKLHQDKNLDLNQIYNIGKSPLICAAQEGRNDIIRYLLDQSVIVEEKALSVAICKDIDTELLSRMLKSIKDINYNEGNNIHCLYALYYSKIEALNIDDTKFSFNLQTYYELLNYIKNQQEAKNLHKIDLGSMAAKFACLFDSQVELESYIKEHGNNSNHPLHDLSIFTLPKGNWNKNAWKSLAVKYGLKLTKYLFLAPEIERRLGQAPDSFEEVQAQAKIIKYNRAIENQEMASLFHDNVIPEDIFEEILNSYKEKTQDYIPDIYIEGKNLDLFNIEVGGETFEQSRYYMKKLAPSDLRGFILGNKTNCCQYVGAAGHDCAIHGMTSAYGGFYVIFKREKEGRCKNLSQWLKDLEQSLSKEEFFNFFKEKALKNKYKKIIENMEVELRLQYRQEVNFEIIKKILSQDFKKELEGEIIAQSWVWISKNGDLVLDSWERSFENYDILFKPFMKKLAEIILTENKNIKKLLIGSSGCTPNNIGFHQVNDPQKPRDYNGYRDSNTQYLIAERLELKDLPNSTIKVNNAFNFSNKRIQELDQQVR
jgi:hypothetical protein